MSCEPKGDRYFHPKNGLERVFRPLNWFFDQPWLPGGHFKAIAKIHQSGFKLR